MVADRRFMDDLVACAGIKYVTAATTLTPSEQVVHATPPTSSTYAITLPPASQCKGKIFTVVTPTDDTGTVTVQDQDDGTPAYTSGALTAANDFVVLYCDGVRWYELAETTT